MNAELLDQPLPMLYCKVPEPPDATIEIVPSFTPQSVGSVDNTFDIIGSFGAVSVTEPAGTKQVAP